MTTVRVASYNLRDLRDDRDAAAAVVRRLSPDVLCLQEVPRRLLAARRVAAFARECGMQWRGPHRGSGGTTILTSSRMVVHDIRHERLPVPFLQRTRGYAVARVAVPRHHELAVASIHLGLDERERLRHLDQVLGALEAIAAPGPDGPPTAGALLAGDLNEGPGGPVRRALDHHGLRLVSTSGPTFPAARPRVLIDVVLASADVTVRAVSATGLDRADVVAASDHLPVWADLDLPAV